MRAASLIPFRRRSLLGRALAHLRALRRWRRRAPQDRMSDGWVAAHAIQPKFVNRRGSSPELD